MVSQKQYSRVPGPASSLLSVADTQCLCVEGTQARCVGGGARATPTPLGSPIPPFPHTRLLSCAAGGQCCVVSMRQISRYTAIYQIQVGECQNWTEIRKSGLNQIHMPRFGLILNQNRSHRIWDASRTPKRSGKSQNPRIGSVFVHCSPLQSG